MSSTTSTGISIVERIREKWKNDPTKHAKLQRLKNTELGFVDFALKPLKSMLEERARSGRQLNLDIWQRNNSHSMLSLYEIACEENEEFESQQIISYTDFDMVRRCLEDKPENEGDWILPPKQVQDLSDVFQKMVPFLPWIGERWKEVLSLPIMDRTLMDDLFQDLVSERSERIKWKDGVTAELDAAEGKPPEEVLKLLHEKLGNLGAELQKHREASLAKDQEIERLNAERKIREFREQPVGLKTDQDRENEVEYDKALEICRKQLEIAYEHFAKSQEAYAHLAKSDEEFKIKWEKVITDKEKGIARLKEKLAAKDEKIAQLIEANKHQSQLISPNEAAIQAKDAEIAKLTAASKVREQQARQTEQKHATETGKLNRTVDSLNANLASLTADLQTKTAEWETKTTDFKTTMQTAQKLKIQYDKRGAVIENLEGELSAYRQASPLQEMTKERDDALAKLKASEVTVSERDKELETQRRVHRTSDDWEERRTREKMLPLEREIAKLKVDLETSQQETSAVRKSNQMLMQAKWVKDKELDESRKTQAEILDAAEESNRKSLDRVRSELDLVKAELEKEKAKNQTLGNLHETTKESNRKSLDTVRSELDRVKAELEKEKAKNQSLGDLPDAPGVDLEQERAKTKKLTEHVAALEQYIDTLRASITVMTASTMAAIAAVNNHPPTLNPPD